MRSNMSHGSGACKHLQECFWAVSGEAARIKKYDRICSFRLANVVATAAATAAVTATAMNMVMFVTVVVVVVMTQVITQFA